jgi:hypothetical protein
MPTELVFAGYAIEGIAAELPANAAALAMHLRAGKESLAAQALAIGLWRLRDAGVIGLELRKGKALGFIPKTDLVATLTGSPVGWTGAEGELLSRLAEAGPKTVERLVSDWYGKKSAVSPEHVVLDRLRDRAIESGLVSREQVDANRGMLGRAILGDTKQAIVVNATAWPTAVPQLEQLAADWFAFTQREPELAKQLLERVDKTIEAKEMSDSDSSDGVPDFD